MQKLMKFLLIWMLLPASSYLAHAYSFDLVLTEPGAGNGSVGSICTTFTLALESALGVRCEDSEAIYYKGTGNIVVKKGGGASADLTKANAALQLLVSQSTVSSAVQDAIRKNVFNGIYWANEAEYQQILKDTGNLVTGGAEEISNLLNKSKALQSGSTGTYVKQEFQMKLAKIKELTRDDIDLLRIRDVEVFYNKFTTGSTRYRSVIAQLESKGFQPLYRLTDEIFTEISTMNPFHPDYASQQSANVWLLENYTHDGLIFDLQAPQGKVFLTTDVFSHDSTEKYYALEIRRTINRLIVEGKNDPKILRGISFLFQADYAFSSGDEIGAQRLIDRAQNFISYEKGTKSNLLLSSQARKIFKLNASSSSFVGNEAIQIANYIADLVVTDNGGYSGSAIKFVQETLDLALSQTSFRVASFYLETASRVIDELEGRKLGYFNGGMVSNEGYVDNNDPTEASRQLIQIAHTYRSFDMKSQADRLDSMAVTLENYNSGNSLPYQSAKLSNEARQKFNVDFKPDSFLGYESIHLVNRMATSARIIENKAYQNAAMLIALNLMARQSKDLKEGIHDIEQGWSLIDFAEGVTYGLFSSAKGTVEGLAQLIFHPIDTTVALGKAIYNYKETDRAIREAIVNSYETLKNCDINAKACGELIGKIAGDIAQLYLPVGQLAAGAELAASARIAAIAETKLAQEIIKSGAKIGLESGEDINRLFGKLDNLNPCNVAKESPRLLQFNVILYFLFPTANANIKPCKGNGYSLVDKEWLIKRLSANPRMSVDKIDEVLTTAEKRQLRELNDIEALARWDKGTFGSLDESLHYHLSKHGSGELGKYLRQSANFNKKGARALLLDDGATRWNKGNEFLIEREGWIVSYGRNN